MILEKYRKSLSEGGKTQNAAEKAPQALHSKTQKVHFE